MPPIGYEVVAGAMGILRIGPVTVPLHSMVRIAMRSEALLILRRPRLEVQTSGVPAACEIVDVWVGASRPNLPWEGADLGAIRPGELITAIVANHSSNVQNASVAVDGDAARVVHWAVDCPRKQGGGCADCLWRTQCRHEECERSGNMETRCRRWQEEQDARRLALSAPASGSKPEPGGLWRPWDPLRG